MLKQCYTSYTPESFGRCLSSRSTARNTSALCPLDKAPSGTLSEMPDSGRLSLAPADVTVAETIHSGSTPAMIDGGGVVGVVVWAAMS